MSPEQALGRTVDVRSDIYSSGVVMYELLTGRLPFVGGSVAETLYRIVHSQPEPIVRLNPRVPPLLERIVMKALDKQVEQRYQHAREELADLRNVTPAIETTRPRTAAAKRTSQSIDSLAVLPLQAMTAAAAMDYLADGITTARTSGAISSSTPAPTCWRSRKNSSTPSPKAVECFEQAIAADDRYALAYAGLADCFTLLTTARYVDTLEPASMRRARSAAERAIALDGQLADAHCALGFVRFRVDWDWPGAQASFERACERNPGHATTHHRYALLLSALGRHDDALREIQRARELDPLSLIMRSAHGRILHFARRYLEAVDHCRQTIELATRSVPRISTWLWCSPIWGGTTNRSQNWTSTSIRTAGAASCSACWETSWPELDASSSPTRCSQSCASASPMVWRPVRIPPTYSPRSGNWARPWNCSRWRARKRAGLAVYFKVEPLLDPVRTHPRFSAMLRRLRFE